MTRGQAKPQRGCFAAMMPSGVIWPDTIRHRARDSRRALGEIFVGWRMGGKKIETSAEGWARAKKDGYTIVKVDVLPAAKDTP